MSKKRKPFFGVIYLLFGLLVGLGFAGPPGHRDYWFVLLSVAFLVASAGAFAGAGTWWRVLHVMLSVAILCGWFAAWAYLLPYMLGTRHTVDTQGLGLFMLLIAAVVMTIPVGAYAVGFVRWLRGSPGSSTPIGTSSSR